MLSALPTHPLLVHLPVVLVPLATLSVVLLALRPVWLHHYGFLAAVFAGAGFAGALFAADSGEELEEQLRGAGETISGTLRDHVELGDKVQGVVGLFFVITLVWIVVAWLRRRAASSDPGRFARAVMILSVLAVLSGVTASAVVVKTGHSGAESVWEGSGP